MAGYLAVTVRETEQSLLLILVLKSMACVHLDNVHLLQGILMISLENALQIK